MKQLRVGRFTFVDMGRMLGVSMCIAASLFHPLPVKAQLVGSTNFFSLPFDSTQNLISFSPWNRQQLFRASDTISIQASNNQTFTVFDLRGNVLYQGGQTNLQFSPGHYFVETDGDRNQFAVLPNDYAGAPFLGTDANNGWSVLSNKIQQIQPTWMRTGAGMWDLVQPQRDVWDWSAMDLVVSNSFRKKLISSTAWTTPSWVQSNELMQAYTNFVHTMAARYKGKLAAIEIWNEPWYDKFPGTANLDLNGFVHFYLTLHQNGRAAIKSADHKPLVFGPVWASLLRDESLTMTVSNNSLNLFDGWSWHDYNAGDYAPDHDYLAPIWVRSISKDHLAWNFGSATVRKHMYVGELGLYGQSALGCPYVQGDPSINWYTGMSRAIKALLLYRAAGVVCVIPEDMTLANEPPNPNLELFGWDYNYRGPHPKTSAFLMTSYWLNRATYYGATNVGNQVYLSSWRRSRTGTLVFAWSPEGQSATLFPVSGFTTTDIYGQTVPATSLGEEPVLFHQIKSISPLKAMRQIAAAVQVSP